VICKFSANSASERIIKISQYLTKIWTKVGWHVFLWFTVYILTARQWSRQAQFCTTNTEKVPI